MINENYDALLRSSKGHKTPYLGDHTKGNEAEKEYRKGKKSK